MSLGTFFSSIESGIGDFFAGIGKFLSTFLTGLASSIAQNGGKVLIDAAVAAVAAAEAKGGTAQDKLAAAQAAVLATLSTEGIPVVMNAVNGAIEGALANLKAQAADPAAPAA